MAFAQNMQCFVLDRYYRHLKEQFPEQTLDALLTAFHRYMFQLGNRAAQRAVRDKNPLDFEHYERYREVVSTEEMIREDSPHDGVSTLSPKLWDSETHVCTAHRLFGQLGTPAELELLFCHHVDKMEADGFNPDIPYEVLSVLCDSDVCHHRCVNPGCAADAPIRVRMPDAPPFPYIMANLFTTFEEVLSAIFGQAGHDISAKVRQEFIDRYGEGDWAQITPFFGSNFDIYYPLGLKK